MRILFTIFLFLLLSACEKDNGGKKTVIKGKVFHIYTGSSVSNIRVILRRNSKGFSADPSDFIPLQRVLTDSAGKFTFEFETEDNTDYYFNVEGNSVYIGSLSQAIEEGKDIYYPVAVKPYVLHELILKFEPTARNKKIIINASGDYTQMENYFFPVPATDTTILFKGQPHANNKICYELVDTAETFPYGAPFTNKSPKYFWLKNTPVTQNSLTVR